jgi:hypothetical protein
MKMSEKQSEVGINLTALKLAISKAIVKHCDEHPETTYAEVNTALVDEMRSNLGYELKALWADEETD